MLESLFNNSFHSMNIQIQLAKIFVSLTGKFLVNTVSSLMLMNGRDMISILTDNRLVNLALKGYRNKTQKIDIFARSLSQNEALEERNHVV